VDVLNDRMLLPDGLLMEPESGVVGGVVREGYSRNVVSGMPCVACLAASGVTSGVCARIHRVR